MSNQTVSKKWKTKQNNWVHKSKSKGRKSWQQERIDALTHYNLSSYEDDIDVLSRLFNIRKSRREWIENTRYDLQMRANKYEHIVGNLLLEHKIHFYHQAPFVIDGHIYFVDFYIPESKTVIEIDGDYHYAMCQKEKDRNRTDDLNFAGAKVIRISNKIVSDKKLLITKLKLNHII